MYLPVYHIFLNQFSVDGYLGRFHVFSIVNNAAMNTGVHLLIYLFELDFSFFQDMCLEVGLLGHMVALFLLFKATSVLFFIMAAPIYIPIYSVGRFHFPHKECIFYRRTHIWTAAAAAKSL